MVKLVKHDLEFILKQIEIAEAHAAGGDLAELVAGYNGNDGLTQAHLLPYGLRTVDGSYNNLLPGRENWGAADQSFPGIFTPNYLNDADGDRYDFNPLPAETWYTNNDYANAGTGSGSSPGPGSGTVIDADPRIISNLIVDQTLDNPAAIAAALTHAGMAGQPLMTALGEIVVAHKAADALAPVGSAAPSEQYIAAKATLDAKLALYGVEMDGNTVYLPNVSPDEGLSSPFNGWMTIFGQFFDHGLDLVAKGGNGTVYVPLSEDDPLYVPGGQNYIPLTRVTVNAGADGKLGTADDGPGPKNLTTPWVDQNQTYASTASKQVFMREYVPGPDGKPIASGLLLEGSNGGLATWADIKEQARDVLGIELTDLNVGNIPLIAADEYGNFIPGANGYPQLVVGMGPDGQLGTADDDLREGNPDEPVSAQGVVLTGHAFLDDIAHAAVPIVTGGVLQADTDSVLGYANADGSPGPQGQRGPSAYDNELLDRHFIAGDGRVNENIALTAVHQVFHAEHNRVVEHTKEVAIKSGDLAFLNEWLLTKLPAGTALPPAQATDAEIVEFAATLTWDGERLFQAGRFTNEMEYQHLVFEEFARMMQPDIDAFVFEPSADINPSIAAEFAHVVYRFGHSMLRQDIAVIEMDENGNPVQNDIALFDGFLNPVMYDSLGDAEAASGAIIRGMSRQTGSAIDEFVTDVLRNQLLGIPLDLATINLARGRDVGTPPLNAAREKFFAETGDTLLKPYESWADFALNLKNPASIINFIAAYGTHETLANTQAAPKTTAQLREAATLLVLGGSGAPADRLDFLNAEGIYAGGTLGGLNTVDFWMGGLAEKKMAFGGMLGSTFSFVFQMTMENLQDADRFYYLSRTQGLNLLNELENNTFAELVMRNTDLGDPESTALPGNVFSAFDMPTIEMDISKQLGADPVSDDPFLGGFSQLIERVDANGDLVAEYIRINSNEHFTIGGTEDDDIIVSGGGDDAIWGKGGDDRIEAGYGVDKVFGGEGDDIITNSGTDIGEADFLHGNEGNDVIHGGSGLSLLFGNQGMDFIITGPDGKEAFGGTGDDFILGGSGNDFLLGNEGDDWIEGGQRFDTLAGENSELFFNSSIIGHDVLNGGSGDTDYDGESGDDIMFQNNEGIQRSNGMAGFDWAIHKGDSQAANSELGIPIFATQEAFILRDRFDLVEGLSGWDNDDTLTGRSKAVNSRPEVEGTAAIHGPDSPLDSYSNDLLAKNVALINGLAPLVAHLGAGIPVTKIVNEETGATAPVLDENGVQERIIFSTADASDILLGGGGSDVIKGLAGNDIIDGDRWLNVRISVRANADGTGPELFSVDSLTELAPQMLSGEINPGQLSIVREIIDGDVDDVAEDIAVYTDIRANYTITRNADGSITVDHTGFTDPGDGEDENGEDLPEEAVQTRPLSDGTDRLFNIEVLRFSDMDVRFTPPQLNLVGPEGQYLDTFSNDSYGNSNGSTSWDPDWIENSDTGVTSGSIRIIEGNTDSLRFGENSNSGSASITRIVDLEGVSTAQLSFSVDVAGFDNNDGEQVRVYFSANGGTPLLLETIGQSSAEGTHTINLTGPFSADAYIRFETTRTDENNEYVFIDNVAVNFTKPAVEDYETTFTEGGNDVGIADAPLIVEDSGEIFSARIVLTNAQAGDQLEVPNGLPGDIDSDIDTSVAGQITVVLTGVESLANYQAAIQAIVFSNSSQNPGTMDRIINVTVNDGFADSNIATTTVNVVAVNDTPSANNDDVVTNITSGNIIIPEWVLLANDTDPEGAALDITSVGGATSLGSLSLTTTPGSVTFTDTGGGAGGDFDYTATDGGATNRATVDVTRDSNGNVEGGNGDEILVGSASGSTFDGGTGNDIVLAGGGNDTIIWNANNNGSNTDGRDYVDGGADTDTFDVNTRANTNESFRVYTVAAATSGPDAIPGLTVAQLRPGTEIIITRVTTGQALGVASIIAELTGIEEIRIGTQIADPTNGSAGVGDSVAIFGNFSSTSLALNTITIDGNEGDDTIDISSLASAHRIVFRSNGGNDTIIGTLRPQDVIELLPGAAVEDYEISINDDGSKTISADGRSVTYFGNASLEDDDDEDGAHGDDENESDDDCDDEETPPDDVDDDAVAPPSSGATYAGTAHNDVLNGSEGDDSIVAFAGDDVAIGNGGADAISAADGDDFITGGSGRDVLFAGAGDDHVFGGGQADIIYGDAGADRIFGDQGNDLITAGAGDDTVFGGAGDDLIVAEVNDGNDAYFGDEGIGGTGIDTLDMSAATADVTVNLGSGPLMNGSASSSQTGNDTIWGIENVNTGSGNDTIIASNTVNVMNGGAGNDTFKFLTTAAANGDTIHGFEPGDRIDLSGIDANTGMATDQSFVLVNGAAQTTAGQLAISFETRADGEFTVLQGNVDGDSAAELRIEIEGHHNLTNSNFNL